MIDTIDTQVRSEPDRGGQCDRFGRKITIRHAATLAFIAVMAVAGYFTLERAIYVQRASATAIELAAQQQVLSQRIASLTAQYTLGNLSLIHI